MQLYAASPQGDYYDRVRRKGHTRIMVALPYSPTFFTSEVQPPPASPSAGRVHGDMGFYGLGLGVASNYKMGRSLAFEYNYLNGFSYMGALFSSFFPEEVTHHHYFAAIHYWDYRRFSLGLGTKVSLNRWYENVDEPEPDAYSDPQTDAGNDLVESYRAAETYWALGLNLSAFRVWRNFRMGFVYRPMIYRFGPYRGACRGGSFSLDLRFSINTGKGL